MPETDLVSLVIYATGWYDTGRTSITASVHKAHYAPDEAKGETLTDRETLFERKAEVFLTPFSETALQVIVGKALDTYTTYLELP